MADNSFKLQLFGAFEFQAPDGSGFGIQSMKARALICLLALAPNGRHSRALIQEMLWGRVETEYGRSSLRRVLSDLRRKMGPYFSELFETTNSDIIISQERLNILGTPEDGIFLEGLNIAESRFLEWLNERRSQVADRRLRIPSLIEARLSPVVGVIPFVPSLSVTDEPQLGDLLAMEITRALSKCPFVDVLSHLSSRRLQYSALDLSTVRNQLNTDYLVTGSYIIRGGTVILSADFIDAHSERLVWSRDYDFAMDQISTLGWHIHKEIAQTVIETIMVQSQRALNVPNNQGLSVHQRLMAAISLMHQHREDVVNRAKYELKILISEHPGHAMFHAWLAKLHAIRIHRRWSRSEIDDSNHAIWHSEEALRLDPTCSFSMAVRGIVRTNFVRDFDLALQDLDQSVAHDRNNSLAWLLKGAMLAFSDRGQEAVFCTTKARNLSPIDPHRYFYDCLAATAHLAVGDNTTAARLAERSYAANPRHISTLRVKAIAHHNAGNLTAAREATKELMAIDPDFTVSDYLKFHPAAKFNVGQIWARALSDSGVPIA